MLAAALESTGTLLEQIDNDRTERRSSVRSLV